MDTETNYSSLDAWLASFVDSPRFTQLLESAILDVENHGQRAKLLMDLMDYVKPKFKTIDAPPANDSKEIHVEYVLDDKKAGT